MSLASKSKKLDAKYAPPLNSEHVTVEKLKKLKIALWIAYVGLPISLLGILSMFILDDNHPIAESVPVALTVIGGFFIAFGAFLYLAFNPIYRRLMNRVLELDEGELYLQHQAYAFSYGVIFKGCVFVTMPLVILTQVVNLGLLPVNFPQVDGAFIPLSCSLVIIMTFLLVIMLPMIYLAWNLKPVGEND